MKYYSESLACINRSDEYELVKKKLELNGGEETTSPHEADVIMLYTCGSTDAFIKRSVSRVKELSEKYRKKMIVCGCSTVTSPKSYEDSEYILCSPTDFSSLEKFLNDNINQNELKNAKVTYDPVLDKSAIVIQKGCIRKCSYCGIWKAVGGLFSKKPESIKSEVLKLKEQGIFNISLSGDSIADYGVDIGSNIIELLEEICSVDERISFNLLDFHPRMFVKYKDELAQLSANGKIKHMAVPIQSGSMSVLKAMRRDFNIEKFIEGIEELKRFGVEFSTDIIIGFPGETDSDFKETIDLLKQINFSKISVNVYTDLDGSVSSGMPNKVSKKNIMKRYILLKESAIDGIYDDFLDYQINKVVYDR